VPNWCHSVLTVSGEAAEVARFVERARPREDVLRAQWEDAVQEDERLVAGGSESELQGVEYATWVEERRKTAPLTFGGHVPEPTPDELAKLDVRITCECCGGSGRRPMDDVLGFCGGDLEAAESWYEWANGCNGCHGEGTRVRDHGWYLWRIEHWGTKWDAHFDGPFVAISTDERHGEDGVDLHDDVEASTESLDLYQVEGTAVYRFDTAWSPPVAWLAAAAAQHPDLRLELRWGEPGADAGGILRYADGALAEEVEGEAADFLPPEQMWF
jgi:hypothetical protein